MDFAPQPWHALPPADVEAALGTGPEGLPCEEARARLARVGANRLPEPVRPGPLRRLLAQLDNPLIYVLLAAAGLCAFLAHWVDMGVILAVVALNAIVGYVQEGRAERSLEAIRSMLDPRANVVRGGEREGVRAEELVPGDRVLLEPGDRVPADVRLVEAEQLRVDEAILTGESEPAAKGCEPQPEQTPLADRSGVAYAGTMVAAGRGVGVVVATGSGTELGRISGLLGSVETLQTPLTRQLDAFARQVTGVILAASVVLWAVAVWWRHYPPTEAFLVVVGLAVAAIPEGLPAVVTITLAVGVGRMAARNAIVRHLPAVEALGAVSIICSDKTGTLTRNEMMVQVAVVEGVEVQVGGEGYAPHGAVEPAGSEALLLPLARAVLLCNDADLHQVGAAWRPSGDPMEAALVAFARKVGLEPTAERHARPRVGELPFEVSERYMATLHGLRDGPGAAPEIFVKGAPERVLAMVDAPEDVIASWHRRTHDLAQRGLRVLAVATRRHSPGQDGLCRAEATTGLTLLGLVGLIDPPREAARVAVQDCRAAGIRVKMITGDHAITAGAIAAQLGMTERPLVRTGAELEQLADGQLAAVARETEVFARTTPELKLRLVEALQADGSVVAMTGDGVNDAPALKRADVGVSMGVTGTEVAKEASQMVLADDNFASIVAAVREGRTVYDNITKVIAWTLPTNGGETFAVIGAMLLGWALPVSAVQILWINLVTAVALGLTLAWDPPSADVMRRAPREPRATLLTRALVGQTLLLCVLFTLGVFAVFFWMQGQGATLEATRTAVVHTIVAMEIGYLLNVRTTVAGPGGLAGLWATSAVRLGIGVVVLCQLAFTYWGPMQVLFQTRPLTLGEWSGPLLAGGAVWALVEVGKRLLPWFRNVSPAR